MQSLDLKLPTNTGRHAHFFRPLRRSWYDEKERMSDPCGRKGYALEPWWPGSR